MLCWCHYYGKEQSKAMLETGKEGGKEETMRIWKRHGVFLHIKMGQRGNEKSEDSFCNKAGGRKKE